EEIKDPSDEDPMEVVFKEKLASARQLAESKRLRAGEIEGWTSNQTLQGSLLGQRNFQQPFLSYFSSDGVPFYSNAGPHPGAYQRLYESLRGSWNQY
ncbi:26681_t:CDS:1, partial [Gigaspora margarita]